MIKFALNEDLQDTKDLLNVNMSKLEDKMNNFNFHIVTNKLLFKEHDQKVTHNKNSIETISKDLD